MTPDEALRHEWMLSSSTSHQKSSDLRHSQSDASVSHTLNMNLASGISTSNDNYSNFRLHHKCTSKIINEKHKSHKSTLDCRRNNENTSIDSNLNDSGTFLPPIL